MNTNLIARKAVIASLSTGAWRTQKKHKGETAAVNAKHGTTDRALVKVAICDHPLLDAIAAVTTKAYTEHTRLTTPAVDRGMRLLPGSRQLEHSSAMQAFAAEHARLVEEFCAVYPQERARNQVELNGLFVDAHWPDVQTVRSSFRLAVRYLPVPSLGQWDEWLAESAEAAKQKIKDRIGEALRAVSDKLGQPDKIFRDSLVTNLRDVLDLAVDLNVGQDADIKSLVDTAREVATQDPDQLREDATVRASTAARAADLCSMFSL